MKRAAEAVSAVLKKCNNSIERLESRDNCPMRWPGHEVIPLPKLTHLILGSYGGGQIQPHNLENWTAQMPSLRHLVLDSVGTVKDAYHQWKHLFDAMRYHKKGMSVKFDEIIAKDATEITFDYHTGDFQRF